MLLAECEAGEFAIPAFAGCRLSSAVDADSCELTLTCGSMPQRTHCVYPSASFGPDMADCEAFRNDSRLGGWGSGGISADMCMGQLSGISELV